MSQKISVVPFNLTDDYQQEEKFSDETALLNKWMKDEDTRKYAEKLTKYSENRETLSDVDDQAEQSKVFRIRRNGFKYNIIEYI